MCLIAYANKDRSQIPNVHLERAHAINKDSWGLMFPTEDNRLMILKECTPHTQFRTAWGMVPFKTPVAVHFRYRTAGKTTVENAHPISVLNYEEHGVDLAMMHNGTLHIRGEGDASDSFVLVRDILRPILADDPSLIESESWRFMVGRMISANDHDDNKLLFMRGDGEVYIVNEHQGVTKNRVWYSNEYSIASYSGYGNGKGADKWDDWMYGYERAEKRGDGHYEFDGKKGWIWVESSHNNVVPLPKTSDKVPVVLSNGSHDAVQQTPPVKTIYEQAADIVRKVISAKDAEEYPLRACTCSDEKGYECHCPPVSTTAPESETESKGYVQRFDSEMADDPEGSERIGDYMYSPDHEDLINGIPVQDLRISDLPNCSAVSLQILCEEHPSIAADLLLECVQY